MPSVRRLLDRQQCQSLAIPLPLPHPLLSLSWHQTSLAVSHRCPTTKLQSQDLVMKHVLPRPPPGNSALATATFWSMHGLSASVVVDVDRRHLSARLSSLSGELGASLLTVRSLRSIMHLITWLAIKTSMQLSVQEQLIQRTLQALKSSWRRVLKCIPKASRLLAATTLSNVLSRVINTLEAWYDLMLFGNVCFGLPGQRGGKCHMSSLPPRSTRHSKPFQLAHISHFSRQLWVPKQSSRPK